MPYKVKFYNGPWHDQEKELTILLQEYKVVEVLPILTEVEARLTTDLKLPVSGYKYHRYLLVMSDQPQYVWMGASS